MVTRKDLNFKDFETILEEERGKVKKNIEAIKAEVGTLSKENEIGDFADMAELQIDNVTDQKLLHQLETVLSEIDAALDRIKAGTYGICEKTSQPIPSKRLIANPWARTVVSA
jgi:DnaK suppressor protein